MINKFHPTTVWTITRSLTFKSAKIGFQSIGEILQNDQIFPTLAKRGLLQHEKAIKAVNDGRNRVCNMPYNEHLIYELCKKVNDLADLEQVDFNGSDYEAKRKLISHLVPYATQEALSEGVYEYHHSFENIQMDLSGGPLDSNGSHVHAGVF